jgi:hypothetical protein
LTPQEVLHLGDFLAAADRLDKIHADCTPGEPDDIIAA